MVEAERKIGAGDHPQKITNPSRGEKGNPDDLARFMLHSSKIEILHGPPVFFGIEARFRCSHTLMIKFF